VPHWKDGHTATSTKDRSPLEYCDRVWQATTTIQACDTRRLRNEVVLHLIQVRG
jgi:hypothetical protein